MNDAAIVGLSAAEVAERVRHGEVNQPPSTVWRDYAQILVRNLVTWFNAMVTPAAVALFVLGDAYGGLAVSGMAIVNSGLGLFQELRAKRQLDKLAILVETKARVRRDGQVREISAGEVVKDDCVLIAGGEAVVADGTVLEARFLEVDEALLTGESDPVRREVGQPLLSGSYCVAGEGAYRAEKVGGEAFANLTAAKARRYDYSASPLTLAINRIVQALTLVALALILLYTAAYFVRGFPKSEEVEYVRMVAATITSMVPQGMVLTATLAFSLGAIYMSRRGAIVQRLSAVETMASIDVICTDKTGTLTTNHLRLDQFRVLADGVNEEAVRHALALFASLSVDQNNKNIQALEQALGKVEGTALEQIPFKSQNRYSAVRLAKGDRQRVLVLGAMEALRDRLAQRVDLDALMHEWQGQGLRILLFTETVEDVSLAGLTALPAVPLKPLALIGLADELRPDAGEVLEQLNAQGIDFKVISGDNPETVRGTIRHLNLPLARDPVVTGDELAKASDPAALIVERSVFGRVAPEQKVQIVETLQKRGRHVAMIGDGVNDVLPIKRADLGIAMGEGSQASKTVSGLVLENNNFSLLPETLEEGRTILRNLRRSAKLFLVKNVYSFILILAYFSGWFGFPFPYIPQQVTLLNWLVIGLPALVIALSRERSTAPTKSNFLREVGWFALRTGVVFGLAGLTILAIGVRLYDDEKTQRTLLLSVLILLGITALWRALKDGEGKTLEGDTRFRLVGIAAVPTYLAVMYWPLLGNFFELTPLGWSDWLGVLAVAAPAYGLSWLSDQLWRRKQS
jgi:cation-transporting ATPase E